MPSRKPVDRFAQERILLAAGIGFLAGVDEAGRGPLAGPVTAAAVILPRSWVMEGIPKPFQNLNDSKQLTPDEREDFYRLIVETPGIRYAVAEADHVVIDAINILQATYRAMNSALKLLGKGVDHALVDGRPVPSLRVRHTALVKGDSLSYSIAAASVLAKVTRDRYMLEAHQRWPSYGFHEHKGYPTPDHLAAIETHGPCPIHRMTFSPLKKPEPELFGG